MNMFKKISQDIDKHTLEQTKDDIEREFKKISKSNKLNNCITNIYIVQLYFNEMEVYKDTIKKPHFKTHLRCSKKNAGFKSTINNCIKDYIDKEHYSFNDDANQLDWSIPYTLKKYLETQYNNKIYWCASTNKTLNMLRYIDWDLYQFPIIEFDKNEVLKNLSFDGELHPFFKEIQIKWTNSWKDLNITPPTYDEIFRRASLCSPFLYKYTGFLNILSTLNYESDTNLGSILTLELKNDSSFATRIKKNFKLELELKNGIKFNQQNQKKIRKLLELTKNNLSLILSSSGEIVAIGSLLNNHKDNIIQIKFTGNLSWDIYKNDKQFLRFKNLMPSFPEDENKIKQSDLDLLKSTFSSLDVSELIKIINCAMQQKHGTMLVFSENVEDEIKRLQESGILVKKKKLNDSLIMAATSIDGALMCSPSGLCYSIGTILDGIASKQADSSRGARYNSAVRYIEQQKKGGYKTFIVVISEDGYIDCFSSL